MKCDTYYMVDVERGPDNSRVVYGDTIEETIAECMKLNATYILCALKIIDNEKGKAENKTNLFREEMEKAERTANAMEREEVQLSREGRSSTGGIGSEGVYEDSNRNVRFEETTQTQRERIERLSRPIATTVPKSKRERKKELI